MTIIFTWMLESRGEAGIGKKNDASLESLISTSDEKRVMKCVVRARDEQEGLWGKKMVAQKVNEYQNLK